MDDLKSSYGDSINELIQNLSEHLKFKSNNTSRCNLSSNNLSNNLTINQDKTHSPYRSPNNSLSSTASDLQQQQQNVGMETYFLMQHLLKNGNLIKEAVRRLKFSNNQQTTPITSSSEQTQTNLTSTKQY